MPFDPAEQEVRALDREWAVIRRNGAPEPAAMKEADRGQVTKTSRKGTFGCDSDGEVVEEPGRLVLTATGEVFDSVVADFQEFVASVRPKGW